MQQKSGVDGWTFAVLARRRVLVQSYVGTAADLVRQLLNC